MEKHLGRVISVEVHEPMDAAGRRFADLRIDYPDVNFSRDIRALLVTGLSLFLDNIKNDLFHRKMDQVVACIRE
ncbi:hypothetical protein PCCS19_55260 [Paenibacillus sp. CCS19]|nr:hypothetical protein PCCS19_55260 [Paenibacillus cellulosilyticus]